jgi:Flp pilus assembly protein protease CpaA
MIDYIPFYFIIFCIISITLLKASYTDYKTRKVSIKTWWVAVYIALPLSLILTYMQVLDGIINVMNPVHAFGVIYSLCIIVFLYILATTGRMGGADFIASTIIIITSMPMGIWLGIVYMAVFILVSIIFVFCWRSDDSRIPLVVTISAAYFIAVPVYAIWLWNFFAIGLI